VNTSASPAGNLIRILLVEDNPGDARLLRETLVEADSAWRGDTATRFELSHVDNLTDALARVKEGELDIILLDLTLPDSRGIDTFIMARAQAGSVPIVVLSGLNDERMAMLAVQEGAQDYLVKGRVDSNLLVRSILHAIERNRLVARLDGYMRQLEVSEARFRSMVQATADAFIVVDDHGRVRFVNPAAEELFGCRADELVGELSGFPIATGQTELDIVSLGGRRVSAEMRMAEAEWDGQAAYLASLRDISQRKQAEAALRQLAAIVDSSDDAILATTPSGEVITWNPGAEVVFGFAAAEMAGQSVLQLIHEDRRAQLAAILERAAGGERIRQYETVCMNKAGQAMDVALTISRISASSEQEAGLSVIARDITHRRLTEVALQEALRQDFKRTVQNLQNCVFKTQREDGGPCVFTMAEGKLAVELGIATDSVAGRTWPDVFGFERYAQLEAYFERALAGEPAKFEMQVEDRWLLVSLEPTFDPMAAANGRPPAPEIVGSMVDITDRKRVEEALREALEQERSLGELKSRFVSMASHEFRTPLTTILSASDLLRHYGRKMSEEQRLERIDKIQTEVNNMTALLDDVLTIGKADAGRLEFNPGPVDLETLGRDIVEQVLNTTNGPQHIAFNCLGECTEVFADDKLLRQMISNLLSNAVKYSPNGGSIAFDIECANGNMRFRISDEGIGIPEDDQRRLFESFQRGRNVGHISGTGLGLAIAKKCVDIHGGTIDIQSTEGKGTTVTVTLSNHHPGGGDEESISDR
jgi:PAS domain S-box-containing protein